MVSAPHIGLYKNGMPQQVAHHGAVSGHVGVPVVTQNRYPNAVFGGANRRHATVSAPVVLAMLPVRNGPLPAASIAATGHSRAVQPMMRSRAPAPPVALPPGPNAPVQAPIANSGHGGALQPMMRPGHRLAPPVAGRQPHDPVRSAMSGSTVTQMKAVFGTPPIQVGRDGPGVIQRAQAPIRRRQNRIPLRPTGMTLAQLRVLDSEPADQPKLDLGSTSKPQNPRAPSFAIDVKPRSNNTKFYSSVRLTGEADPGQVYSAYLTSGSHNTHFRWATGGFYNTFPARNRLVTQGQFQDGFDDLQPVHMQVSDTISNRSRLAEQEHLDDIRHAFNLTLGGAESAIRAAERGTKQLALGPFNSADAARTAARNLVYDNLPEASRGMGRDYTQWEQQYKDLADKTGWRDTRNWHSFGVAETPAPQTTTWSGMFRSAANSAWKWWTKGKSIDATEPGHVRIGQVTTNALINFRSRLTDNY